VAIELKADVDRFCEAMSTVVAYQHLSHSYYYRDHRSAAIPFYSAIRGPGLEGSNRTR
jgi:hypothetical protein